MKSCPTCNRTFEDTCTFCLVDGAILSAPFDPHATLVDARTRHNELQPTQLSPPHMLPAGNTIDATATAQSKDTAQPEPVAKTIPAAPNLRGVEFSPPAGRPLPGQFVIEPTRRGKFLAFYLLLLISHWAITLAIWLLSPMSSPSSPVVVWFYLFIDSAFRAALLGGIQAFFLRNSIRSVSSWILVTVAGSILGILFREGFWRLVDYPKSTITAVYIYGLFVHLVIIGFIATLQWLLLRRAVSSAWTWVVAGLTAGGVSYLLIEILSNSQLYRFSFISLTLGGLISSLVVGLFQGICLIQFRKKQIA